MQFTFGDNEMRSLISSLAREDARQARMNSVMYARSDVYREAYDRTVAEEVEERPAHRQPARAFA